MNLKLEELVVYNVAMDIGEVVWKITLLWDGFSKYTLGKQFVTAADSIGLNIAEGYGRYHYKENLNFCYYSRGSAKETLTVVTKSYSRKLISEEEYILLTEKLNRYFRLMYGYIKSIGPDPK